MRCDNQTGAQYSAVEKPKNRAAVRRVVAPASLPYPQVPSERVTRVDSFFAQCLEMVADVNDLPSF